MLPGEGHAGQVLRGGTGADRHLTGAETTVGPADVLGEAGRHLGVGSAVIVTCRLGRGVGRGGDDETVRNRQAERHHLAQVGALAPDQCQVGRPYLVQPGDLFTHHLTAFQE